MREAVIVHVAALCDPLLDADDLFHALVYLERDLRSWNVPLLIYVPEEASRYAQWWNVRLESAALRVLDQSLDERLRQVWWVAGLGCTEAPPLLRADRVRKFAVEPGSEPQWGSVLDEVARYRAAMTFPGAE